jgi:hypothetical protein
MWSQNINDYFLILIISSVLEGFLGAGCASIPPFQPSQPLDQATSLNEGLFLCNEYRMPVPALRPIYLKPFLSCLEELNKSFDPAETQLTFQTLQKELRKNYNLTEEVEWTPQLGVDPSIRSGIRNCNSCPRKEDLSWRFFLWNVYANRTRNRTPPFSQDCETSRS